ncbi:hypothetical protein EJB05_52135, partial [Eragrostis curvula]
MFVPIFCDSDFGGGAFRASDKCQKEKRKTINGDDLLWAMATLGFEEYVDPLKNYLQKYREGDSKLSTKGGEGSVKKDAISPHGGTSSSSNQLVQHGIYNQGMGYMQPQYFFSSGYSSAKEIAPHWVHVYWQKTEPP